MDAALMNATTGSRFIVSISYQFDCVLTLNIFIHSKECGMISGYNTGGQPVKVYPILFFSFSSFLPFIISINLFHQNLVELVKRSISMYGFVVGDLMPKYIAEFYAEMTTKVVSGEIQHRQQVYDGLANCGEAIAAVQKGLNTAKAVVHVAD